MRALPLFFGLGLTLSAHAACPSRWEFQLKLSSDPIHLRCTLAPASLLPVDVLLEKDLERLQVEDDLDQITYIQKGACLYQCTRAHLQDEAL